MTNEEKNNGISLLHDLTINHKGRLVWTSSYEALQSFSREALNLSDGNWSTPGGHAKLYQEEDIALIISGTRIPNRLYLDPVYTVPDSRSHDIDFDQFAVIFTLTTFSLIICC